MTIKYLKNFCINFFLIIDITNCTESPSSLDFKFDYTNPLFVNYCENVVQSANDSNVMPFSNSSRQGKSMLDNIATVGAFCELQLKPICQNITTSKNNELLQQCKHIFGVFESDFYLEKLSQALENTTIVDTTEDITQDVTKDVITQTTQLESTATTTVREKHQDVDTFKTSSEAEPNAKQLLGENATKANLKYEHIYIIAGGLTAFIVFGIYLALQMKHDETPRINNNVHEPFEPMKLESGPSTDATNSNAAEMDIKKETILLVHEESQNDPTKTSELNVIDDNQTKIETIEEPKESHIEISPEIEDESCKLDDSEEQMRRKPYRIVTFDETQNQTRHISCVGISPDVELSDVNRDFKDEGQQKGST